MIVCDQKRHLRPLAALLALLMLLGCTACGAISETETEAEAETDAPLTVPVHGLENAAEIGVRDIDSDFAILCRKDTLTAVAGLRADERMYPASMTKLMTFIVAYEHAEDLTSLVEITNALKQQYPEGSRVGIDVGDLMTVEQMMYALLLSSDTDAALGLANHVAGGEAGFVALMNQKAAEMGLANTRFANVTGLHDADHYSTATEMAAILAYALDIPLGREILTTETYVTRLKYYRNGELTDYRMTFYNTTLRDRFAGNDVSVETGNGTVVLGGKTGFTDEAAYCLATVARSADGREYILITGHASSGEGSARDAAKIYNTYID